MKSKEEIEKNAEKLYPVSQNPYQMIEGFERVAYKKGYIQCQEDMAKDVEYWQGEFDHWYKQAMDMADKYNKLLKEQKQD